MNWKFDEVLLQKLKQKHTPLKGCCLPKAQDFDALEQGGIHRCSCLIDRPWPDTKS